jgi:hypothetical protein
MDELLAIREIVTEYRGAIKATDYAARKLSAAMLLIISVNQGRPWTAEQVCVLRRGLETLLNGCYEESSLALQREAARAGLDVYPLLSAIN